METLQAGVDKCLLNRSHEGEGARVQKMLPRGRENVSLELVILILENKLRTFLG